MSSLHAGIATVDITPYVGIRLAGFAGRKKPSQGGHDPLRARALVLDDGSARLALITSDIISLPFETVDELKAMLADECDLAPERVMVNCSHTHSGPTTSRESSMGGTDGCYMAVLLRTLAGAVKMAQDGLAPARIGAARTDVQIGINRRERTPDGDTKLGRNPDLPVAPYVDVFRVDGEDGRPRAILFSHACHPVTMAADNYLISADYPGRAQEVVEAVFVGAQAMFAQGCAGNINSEPVGGTFDDVYRLGSVLGGAVVKAAASVETRADVSLRWSWERLDLPLQDPPPAEEAQAALEQARAALREAEAGGDPTQVRIHTGLVNWNERVWNLAKDGATGLKMRYDVQAFAIGDYALVGLPGEVFVEYQLNIEAASPFAHTTVLGVTNGCPCYIPTAAEFPFGGYEVRDSIRYYGATMLAAEAEAVILEGAQRQLRAITAGTAD